MKKIKIAIPDGKKAEWIDDVLHLVDDVPVVNYTYRILRGGMLLGKIYQTAEDALADMQEGDTYVTMEKEPSKKIFTLPKFNLHIKWGYVAIVVGLLLAGYGIYKFINTGNDTSNIELVKIAAVSAVGVLAVIFGYKSED